jgi:hypothetical protein
VAVPRLTPPLGQPAVVIACRMVTQSCKDQFVRIDLQINEIGSRQSVSNRGFRTQPDHKLVERSRVVRWVEGFWRSMGSAG